MNLFRVKDPFIFTIFGASGDLAKIKIFPALYSLMEQKRFPQDFFIVGYARTAKTQEVFRNEFQKAIRDKLGKKINENLLKELTKHVFYFSGQYDKKEDFQKYRDYLDSLTGKKKMTHIAYFSVPPVVFMSIIANLGETKRGTKEDLRLVIEKPFGSDTASATELFHTVAKYFDEDCVYLLDHYLGKTSVQSLLHMRHSNRILNLMMKGPTISNIQITASEDIGVGDRAGYFDQVGIIKDMFQSHLLQILSLITMSIPITEHAGSLHREKNSIISALKLPGTSHKNIVLGQYAGYKKESGVAKNSQTPTFFACRLFIDRESWFQVPIYFRTGKKLDKKHTYVVIEIRKFKFQSPDEEPNRLIFELQPNEQINIRLVSKSGTGPQGMMTSQSIACTGDDCLPEHGALLMDVFRQNKLHFLSFPEIIASWTITDSILQAIDHLKIPIQSYGDGTSGPESQSKLTTVDGFEWFDVEENQSNQ